MESPAAPFPVPVRYIHHNYVQWLESPESPDIYTVDIPVMAGVKKEELRVEVEDSVYLIIRTEAVDESTEGPAMKFERKIRFPEGVDIRGVSARYEDGVLTVTVPRMSLRRGYYYIDPADVRVPEFPMLASAA